jgi:uncharacterized membrane protein YjjP (DUF1212 family)
VLNFIRRIVVLAFMVGGVWGAFWLMGIMAQAAGDGDFHLTREAAPLLIPMGLLGALIGGFVGGVLFPVRH